MKVAGGYAFRTAPDLSEKLKIERPVTRKLSRASIETLAIIAYHQPVTRAEIEQVRGVGLSKGTLDLLFEQNWIKPMGRRRAPGKPVTWGTTDFFLEHFGLPSLDDLPGQEELKAAGLLDARAQPPIFSPEEPDLPLEAGEDEADEPLAVDEIAESTKPGAKPQIPPYSTGCRAFKRGAIIGARRSQYVFGSIFTWVASAYGTGSSCWPSCCCCSAVAARSRRSWATSARACRPSRRASGDSRGDAAGPAGPAGRHRQADLGPDHDHAAGQPGPPGQRCQGLTEPAPARVGLIPMFGIDSPELLVIAIVALIVIGPKELPGLLRSWGKWMAKMRGMASEFRGHVDEMVRQSELDDVKKQLDAARPRPAVARSDQADQEHDPGRHGRGREGLGRRQEHVSTIPWPSPNRRPRSPSKPRAEAAAEPTGACRDRTAAAGDGAEPSRQPTPAAAEAPREDKPAKAAADG